MSDASETASRLAKTIAALPPLPATAQEILACFGDEFIDADAVAIVVENDPAICGRLLGLSNSSYFGLAEPITDIREAIGRVLGVDTVRSLVLAMAIQRSFDRNRCPAFNIRRFWSHSLQTAECCKRIALSDSSSNPTVRDLAYSTGLCHNLGLMALAHMQPQETNQALQALAEEGVVAQNLRDRLAALIGTDHRIVTSELASVWSLPEAMVNAYRSRAALDSEADDALGNIVTAAAAAVSNNELPEEATIDLNSPATSVGLDADELQKMAILGERQKARIDSLSGNMA